jgi:hypothetical protein
MYTLNIATKITKLFGSQESSGFISKVYLVYITSFNYIGSNITYVEIII